MEITEDKYENDALKHKWADYMERQRWLMSREQPEICSLSTLKREAQTRLRQQSTKEYSKVCQVRDNCIKTQAELLNHQQGLQNRLAETSMQLEDVQNKRQSLYTQKKEYIEEVKKTHGAFASAKLYYKSNLNIYYSFQESQSVENSDEGEIVLEFFKNKKTTSQNYFVTLKKKNNTYELTDMKPMLANFEQLSQRLRDTNDVPGFLSCVRYCFQKSRSHK